MKRLSKFTEPRMVSARVERADAEKFEQLLGTQPHQTLQDFVNYAMVLFISGTIKIDGRGFSLYNEKVNTP